MTRAVVALAAAISLVLGADVAAAASFTLSSATLASAAAATPAMFPVSVTVANKAGGHVGKPENGDVITLVWSQPVDEPTLCSGWANTKSSQSVNLQWSIVNGTGGGNDTLSVTGSSPTCTSGLHVGTIDLGATGYNTSTGAINFPTSTNALTVGATTTTLTVTLNGQKGGTAGTVTSGGAATWTPDAALTDRSGRTCGANLAQSAATVQF